MAKDARHRELGHWLLEAIGKVRRQKQRPNIDRICAAIQQCHADVTAEQISAELNAALKSGAIVCVESKGAPSYRETSVRKSLASMQRRPSLHAKTGIGDLSELVMTAVRDVRLGCSLEMIEKHVLKNCTGAMNMDSNSLRNLLTAACRNLEASRKLSVHDGIYIVRSPEEVMSSRASLSNLSTSDDQLSSTTTADSQRHSDSAARCCICLHREDSSGCRTLIACVDCDYKGHASCMKLSPALARAVRMTRWQCYDCKTCSICRGLGENLKTPDDMIFCDGCDRGFHVECCKSQLDEDRLLGRSGKWLCGTCQLDVTHGNRLVDGDSTGYTDIPEHQARKQTGRSPSDLYSCRSDEDMLDLAPISQRGSKPVIRQVAQCSSEAVVGSSSDVASGDASERCLARTSSESSYESDTDSRSNIRHPVGKPRGLVDALSRYFTPSDKRRSRVSLNALPQASPQSMASDTNSMKSAADTTRSDDASPPVSPQMRHKKFRRLAITGSDSSKLAQSRRCSQKNSSEDLPGGSDSKTDCDIKTANLSKLCFGTEPNAGDLGTPVVVLMRSDAKETNSRVESNFRTESNSTAGAERTVDIRELCLSSDGSRPSTEIEQNVKSVSPAHVLNATEQAKRKRARRTQLSSLQDSLSHFFSAEGDRKRTPASYVESDYAFDIQQNFVQQGKRSRSVSLSRSSIKSLKIEAKPQPSVQSSSVICNSSVYHLSGTRSLNTVTLKIEDDDISIYNRVQDTIRQGICSTTDHVLLGQFPSSVTLGPYVFLTANMSGCSGTEPIHMCEFCLACLKSHRSLARHTRKCHRRSPPGREIYSEGELSVYEVDGCLESVYCHNLCLLSIVFGDGSLCSAAGNVGGFLLLFYVLTRNDQHGSHLVGFVAKHGKHEKECQLSSLLVLPPYRGQRYDIFLVDLGYHLCKMEGRTASLELLHSQSFDILLSRYWSYTILNQLVRRESCTSVAISDISLATGISHMDVINTLKMLNVVISPIIRETVEIDYSRVAELMDKNVFLERSGAVVFKTTCLKVASSSMQVAVKREITPKASAVCSSGEDMPLSEFPKRRKLGRPKGSKSISKVKESKPPSGRRRGRPRKNWASDAPVQHVLPDNCSPVTSPASLLEMAVTSAAASPSQMDVDGHDKAHVDNEVSSEDEQNDFDHYDTGMPKLERKDDSRVAVCADQESRSPSPPMLEHANFGTPCESSNMDDSSQGGGGHELSNPPSQVSLEEYDDVDVEDETLPPSRDAFLGSSGGSDAFLVSSAGGCGVSATMVAQVCTDKEGLITEDINGIDDHCLEERTDLSSCDKDSDADDGEETKGILGSNSFSDADISISSNCSGVMMDDNSGSDDDQRSAIDILRAGSESVLPFEVNDSAAELTELKPNSGDSAVHSEEGAIREAEMDDSKVAHNTSSIDEPRSDGTSAPDGSLTVSDAGIEMQGSPGTSPQLPSLPPQSMEPQVGNVNVPEKFQSAADQVEASELVASDHESEQHEVCAPVENTLVTESSGTLPDQNVSRSSGVVSQLPSSHFVEMPDMGMQPGHDITMLSNHMHVADKMTIADVRRDVTQTSAPTCVNDSYLNKFGHTNIESPAQCNPPNRKRSSAGSHDTEMSVSKQPGGFGSYLSAASPLDMEQNIGGYRQPYQSDQQSQRMAGRLSGELDRGGSLQIQPIQNQVNTIMSPNNGGAQRQMFQFPSGYSDMTSPSMVAGGSGYNRVGGPPSVEGAASPYATNYRRMSASSSSLVQQHPHVSPESVPCDARMPSPSNYYVDYSTGRPGGYGAIRPNCPVQHDGSYGGNSRQHQQLTVKSSPGNCLEPTSASPGNGQHMLMSPNANCARQQSFNMPCRSPATRVDQSPASAGSSGYGSSTLPPLPSRQANFNRPNPSPSASTANSRAVGQTHQSPVGANVFSPQPPASGSVNSGSLALASCTTPDMGLPFQFPVNVAVPVSAATYATVPSPTPHSLQLLSPSVNTGAGNYHMQSSVSGASRQTSTPHPHQQQPFSLLCYNTTTPSPNISYTGMLDQRFNDCGPDRAGPSPAPRPTTGSSRHSRGHRTSATDCSLAHLQQLTNRLHDSGHSLPAEVPCPPASSMQMGMLFNRNVSMLAADPLMPTNWQLPSAAGSGNMGAGNQQPCKQSSRRRNGTSGKVATSSSSSTSSSTTLPFAQNMASYNMLGAFHPGQQGPPPSALDYQRYLAANGFFGQGASQLPVQMMPLGMSMHPHAATSNFVPSQSAQSHGGNQMYAAAYGYNRLPSSQDAFNNFSHR